MFRRLLWHLAKRRLARAIAVPPLHIHVSTQPHTANREALQPTAEPYARLAGLWDELAGWFVPEYGRFLRAAGDHYGLGIARVLDLACGTGLLSREIARWATMVVGLDASAAMLRQARSRPGKLNIRFVQGDFRDFSLGETFDAAICGSDSLNYVASPAELTAVFRCARRHLRPGGVFVLDVLDHDVFCLVTGRRTVTRMGSQQVEMYRSYDTQSRVGDWWVVCGDAIEQHRRIPLDEADVRGSAGDAGLSVAEHFSLNSYRLLGRAPVRQFYVLRVP
jgi:SAM-dependent methyltransferase